MADLTPPGERRAPGLRLHRRTMPVQRASAAIKSALIALQSEWDLTDVEMVAVLLDAAQSVHKYALRRERHPDDPDRKADEE
jgi:hypothetical protein